MATSQTPEDKERFFADLDRLGESDNDEVVFIGEQKLVEEIATPEGASDSRDQEIRSPSRSQQEQQTTTRVAVIEPHSQKALKTKQRRVSMVDKQEQPRSKSSRRARSKDEIELLLEQDRIFTDFKFFFIPNNDIAKPRKTRIRSSVARGATWVRSYGAAVTHVIVDAHLEILSAAKALPEDWQSLSPIFVRDTWLIESITGKYVEDTSQSRFQVRGFLELLEKRGEKQTLPSPSVPASPRPLKRKFAELERSTPASTTSVAETDLSKIIHEMKEMQGVTSDTDASDSGSNSFETTISETSFEENVTDRRKMPPARDSGNPGFQCMQINDGQQDNPNNKTINVLQQMISYYTRTGDHWRTTAYRKAIAALSKQQGLICTREQAIAIPQIGSRLADKIEEIATTNKLKRLENTVGDPKDQALQLFMGIYGVGLAQAKLWTSQGHRTLHDLVQNVRLSSNQKIGIEHYEDFQQRIPKAEVARHGQVVQRALHEVDPQLDAIIGGSYRRGDPDSGDVDVLITKRDANIAVIRDLVMDSVVPNLTRSGFLKVALASSTTRSHGSKWHGACCLPDETTWRRIDLLFVPWAEFGAALIYFTGNDIFNRSLRLLASRKGMRLNQHGLYADVMRGKGGTRITDGQLLEGQSEKKIFDILGVPWRPPEHRKC